MINIRSCTTMWDLIWPKPCSFTLLLILTLAILYIVFRKNSKLSTTVSTGKHVLINNRLIILICLEIIGFPNEKQLLKNYLNGEASVVVAIIFKSKPGDKHLDYTIRLHEPSVNWKTNRLFENVYSFQPGRGED